MKQNFLQTILLCLLSFIGMVKAFAHDIEVKNEDGVTIYYNFTNNNTELEVTYRGSGYDSQAYTGNVIIPESVTYNGSTYSVTSIGDRAFFYCRYLFSVIIPNSVMNIDDYAFWYCTGLYSVIIPNSVMSIGDYTFQSCSNLTSVTIGNNVTSIGDYALSNCSRLTSVTIPNSVTSIGNYAFSNCSGLTFVTIGNSVTSIGYSAFSSCSALTSITIPNSVTSVGSSAFKGCSSLTSVTIPNSVTSISSSTFENCSRLSSVTIPNSVTSIGSRSFYSCHSLTNIDLPNGIIIIGDYAFYGCYELTQITLPNSLTTIGRYAFQYCGLTSITIPNSVEIIGQCAFWVCNDLKTIILSDGIKSIGSSAFSHCYGLQSITIPNSITEIGSNAFEYCSNLKYVNLPNSVTSIENGVFYECKSLTSIQIPNSVTSIGASAFQHCSKLARVTLGDNIVHITPYAFDSYAKFIVKNGTLTLLSLYQAGYNKPDVLGISSLFQYSTTPTSIHMENAFEPINGVTITSQTWRVENYAKQLLYETKNVNSANCIGLNPFTYYNVSYTISAESEHGSVTATITQEILTADVIFITSQPKVISLGNAIVAAESNLDDAETNVGFEWRRTDWTDDFASNTGTAYLYNGRMEGYIRNLNTEKLWKYRPYYLSNSGTYYYGDWVGLDPTNTSYFEPTVHTYEQIEIEGNTALVKGYALTGTDGVAVQGFKYWKTVGAQSVSGANKAAAVPSDAITVTASGQVMTANLTALDYNSTYHYAAFVTTSTGETFYGEELAFSTGEDPTGIYGVSTEKAKSESTIKQGVYTLMGVKVADDITNLHTLPRGVYIVNGKKYFVK